MGCGTDGDGKGEEDIFFPTRDASSRVKLV